MLDLCLRTIFPVSSWLTNKKPVVRSLLSNITIHDVNKTAEKTREEGDIKHVREKIYTNSHPNTSPMRHRSPYGDDATDHRRCRRPS